MKAPYNLATPAQRRAFHLLTLAQMVHLEHTSTRLSHTSARQQAITLLDLSPQAGASGITANELIEVLRKAACDSMGLVDAVAPRKPILPRAMTTRSFGYEARVSRLDRP